MTAISELEKRFNLALALNLPMVFRRKSRMIVIDLTLISYHGRPQKDERELFRSTLKSGTTQFHACPSAVVVHKVHRYILALMRVEHGEAMKDIVQRLLAIVRRRDLKIQLLLLDKELFSVQVFTYLKRAGLGFIIPAVLRGRKPNGRKPPSVYSAQTIGMALNYKPINDLWIKTMASIFGTAEFGQSTRPTRSDFGSRQDSDE